MRYIKDKNGGRYLNKEQYSKYLENKHKEYLDGKEEETKEEQSEEED